MAYDSQFMTYTTLMNNNSAHVVSHMLFQQFHPNSIIDFGCAHGGWLKAWQDNGATDLLGLDGDYVDREKLLIDNQNFIPTDLSQPIVAKKKYDLAQCVEVAEHLPESSASILIKSITSHAPVVLFSAAPPGQGGRGHINEQPYEYWRDLFAKEGYSMFDWIRPQLAGHNDIQPWYKYNLFLFIDLEQQPSIPETIINSKILSSEPVPDISPLAYQLRKKMVRLIPKPVQDIISDYRSR